MYLPVYRRPGVGVGIQGGQSGRNKTQFGLLLTTSYLLACHQPLSGCKLWGYSIKVKKAQLIKLDAY